MSEGLAVLFRLGKALRDADSGEFFEQYDDRLLKQDGLSTIALINQKECARQISELEDEDFSLLQSALAPGSARDTVERLHLELDDSLTESVAEQLETLLERLRMERRGRISVDSGAVSDMESCSGTALEEEDGGGGENGCDSVPLSQTVEGSHGVGRGLNGPGSSADGSEVDLKPSVKESRMAEGSGRDKSESSSAHRTHVKRRNGREATQGGRTEISRSVPARGGSAHARQTDSRFRVQRAEVIEHTPPHRRGGESAVAKSKPAPLASSEQPATETREADGEEGASLTEGGPFITHWGKGRWRKNGGPASGRDRGRRQNNNPHQFGMHPRARFGPQWVNRGRYPSSRGRSFGHHPRPERDPLHGGSYSDRASGQNSLRNGGSSTELQQQKGGESAISHHGLCKITERERSPLEQSGGDSVETARDAQTVAPSLLSVPPQTDTPVKPPVQSEMSQKKLSYVKPPVQSERSQQQKLSYASVTSSNSGSGTTAATCPKPQPTVASLREEQTATVASANATRLSTDGPTTTGSVPTNTDPHTATGSTSHSVAKESTSESTTATKESTPATADKESTNEPTTATATTADHTRVTDGNRTRSMNKVIAASFNYSEAVEFLWKGWQEVQLEVTRESSTPPGSDHKL